METDEVASGRAEVSLRLDHDLGAALRARVAVRRLLAGTGASEERRHDSELVVHELVANAVTHGLPEADGRVSLTCQVVGDQLVVVVTDGGSRGVLEVGELDEESARGRGLVIIDALADSWSVDRSQGTAVRVVLSLR